MELIRTSTDHLSLGFAYHLAQELNERQPLDVFVAQALGLELLRHHFPELGFRLLAYAQTKNPNDVKGFCIFASKALRGSGAFLRQFAQTILDGPVEQLEGENLSEIRQTISGARRLDYLPEINGRQEGNIAERGFGPRRFFITTIGHLPGIDDVCCFRNEWTGPEPPRPGMLVSFEIIRPLSPGQKPRAVEARPHGRDPFDPSRPPELPDLPELAEHETGT